MLLVLAHREDVAAHAFAGRHADRAIRVMHCADLTQRGVTWHMDDSKAGAPQITWRDRDFRLTDVHGVITRLRVVRETDLPHIVASDRAYVAAELHAFLLAFLDTLPWRLNPPSPACLCGPALRGIEWQQHARALAIPVSHEYPPLPNAGVIDERISEVTVIGEHVLGTHDTPLIKWSQQLAARVGASYLCLRYRTEAGRCLFLGADPYPRLESLAIQAALIDHFNTHRLPETVTW